MKRWLPLAFALAALQAPACLNDRDSLAAEVQRKPDVIWILVGRFERNPPLYYQMRIKRIERELASKPDSLDLYDDISVAYDRIHQDDQALLWITKKRVILQRIDPTLSRKMDWYRFFANSGTFHVHHWIGLKTQDATELKVSSVQIAKAIELNPNAHDGREGFQLAAIQWMLANVETADPGDRIPFASSEELQSAAEHSKSRGVDGLAGLVRLGGAWESPDIYDALATRLKGIYRQWILSQVAVLRRDELLDAGHRPFGSMSSLGYDPQGNYATQTQREFKKLREDAEAWAKERNDFMLSRMKAGKHPDTDADFWSGYVERPKPDIWAPPFWETWDWFNRTINLVPAIVVAMLLIWAAFRVARTRRGTSSPHGQH